MTPRGPSLAAQLPAGRFSDWLRVMQAALRGERDADVPCDGCTACCTASQFVHVAPDETGALAHIPAELLVPAPRLPRGHMVMGYDERGHCPMLAEGGCSIYEHRPRACRMYDCRVFAATGLEPEGDAAAPIADRVRRWRFDVVDADDRALHDAVLAAVTSVQARSDAPPTTTGRAVAAVASVTVRERLRPTPGGTSDQKSDQR
jgi:uncharacterized protein